MGLGWVVWALFTRIYLATNKHMALASQTSGKGFIAVLIVSLHTLVYKSPIPPPQKNLNAMLCYEFCGLFERALPTPKKAGDSIATHHISSGASGMASPSSCTMFSASPTSFRILTWRPRNRSRIAVRAMVNPWGFPLMTANCYWRGSELDESRLRWR